VDQDVRGEGQLYRGSFRLGSTVCWNVGRFCRGNAGIETPEALVESVSSLHDASARDWQFGSLPYSWSRVTCNAAAREDRSAVRQRAFEPPPQYTRE
jgi:hypothetical protein